MIGIIGGTGLEKNNILENARKINVNTKYGDPSSPIIVGNIDGKEVAILSRHGIQHTITPTHVNYRANIEALKSIGCTDIIATTACGSLREEIAPGHFIIPDQFIDFTKLRTNTFYDEFEPNNMKHCPMANPYNDELRKKLMDAATAENAIVHDKGTLITIEGPRFSTKAESRMFRLWGADLINMSTATESALANEAEVNYAIIAVATDYDCWRENEVPVSLEMILQNFQKSIITLQKVLLRTIKSI